MLLDHHGERYCWQCALCWTVNRDGEWCDCAKCEYCDSYSPRGICRYYIEGVPIVVDNDEIPF